MTSARQHPSKADAVLAARVDVALSRMAITRIRGHDGSHDAARRSAASWPRSTQETWASAFVPPIFDPGEAHRCDRRHEIVSLDGGTTTAKAADVHPCHGRMRVARHTDHAWDNHQDAAALKPAAAAQG